MIQEIKESEILRVLKEAYSGVIEFIPIESQTQKGIPDLYYYSKVNSFNGWIELKVIQDGDLIPYRAGQVSWLYKHRDQHEKTFCLIYKKGFWFLIDDFSKFNLSEVKFLFKAKYNNGKRELLNILIGE